MLSRASHLPSVLLTALFVASGASCADEEQPPCDVWPGPGYDASNLWAVIPAGTHEVGPMGWSDGLYELTGAGESPSTRATVTLTYDLMIDRYPITEQEFLDVMGYRRPGGQWEFCATCASIGVGWSEALLFANLRSEEDGLSPCYDLTLCRGNDPESGNLICPWDMPLDLACDGWRLPTAVEWEIAARDGRETVNYCSDSGVNAECMRWYARSYAYRNSDIYYTPSGGQFEQPRPGQPVGGLCPTGVGLYDMFGNEEEWVWGWNYADEIDENGRAVDPVGRNLLVLEQSAQPAFATRGGGVLGTTSLDLVIARVSRSAEAIMLIGAPGMRLVRTLTPPQGR